MIKTITVTNQLSESVVFDLRSPEQSGFFVRKVDGLGPSKATINMSDSLSLDGSVFNSARLNKRNIVFDLGFLEKPTIEDTRQKLYRCFPIKTKVQIVIETDNRTLITNGYVESNEPNIFSKEEASSVSVVCEDAYLRSLTTVVVNFSAVSSLFEFPFSNESLTEKLIIFGNVVTEPENNVVYTGESPVGFRMYIHATGTVGTFTIYNLNTRESMLIDSDILQSLTGSGIISGDEIIISTIRGNKYVDLVRDGETYNILNSLGPDSDWFSLTRGDNLFYYTAVSGESNLQFRIEYELLFEGI